MTVSYSTNLGLALPAQGDWAGSWGTNQNQFITQYLDAAIAGAQVISGSQTAVTLSTTNGLALSQAGSGATGSAQYAVINCTGNPASMLTITAPSTDKTYVIINATSTNQAVKIVGVGPTTGVTVAAARAAMVAWNGADFVLVATTDASKLAGTLAVANGGTGQITYTNGELLIGNSTGNTLTKANLTAGTGIAITNGAGSITVGGTAATLSDIGMVKLGDATVQTVAANAVTATASRTYALQLNASGQAVVNVPWTNTAGSPAGSNTQIQFNNAGVFGASANLTFASDTLSVNSVSVGRGAGAHVSNTAIGTEALFSNTSGFSNTALGYQALRSNVANGDSTAVGREAAQYAVGGSSTALGAYALQGNFAGATGAGNIAIGVTALNNFTTASYNIAIGNNAMYSTVASAQQNTAIGMSALTNVSGNNNTALGFASGIAITSGSKNTILGSYSGNLGGLDIRTASNYIVLSDGDGNPRWYVDNTGTAGYAPSTGASATQGTSRTTPVTINTPTGRITLVSAAGTTAWQSFTVNNSSVTSLDTVRVVQRSGTDLYQIFVTNVSAGSFRITFATTGGTTTEQPTFNFAVLKGQVS